MNPSSEQTRQNDEHKTLRDNTMYVKIANPNAIKNPNPRPMAMARVQGHRKGGMATLKGVCGKASVWKYEFPEEVAHTVQTASKQRTLYKLYSKAAIICGFSGGRQLPYPILAQYPPAIPQLSPGYYCCFKDNFEFCSLFYLV